MTRFLQALLRFERDARTLGLRWALVGGLAVSVRAEPRQTRDIDVAVAIADDREAERIVFELRGRGYLDNPEPDGPLLETRAGRFGAYRLLVPGEAPPAGQTPESGLPIDLFFGLSGVEPEVVAAAEEMEVLPGLVLSVATIGHLLALKVLADRPRDLADLTDLLEHATPEDERVAYTALRQMTERDTAPDRDLLGEWEALRRKL